MNLLRCAVAMAVMGMTVSTPRLVLAQQACTISSDCGTAKACVGGACHDPIYCTEDKDCGDLLCNQALHGCICEKEADCGTSGTCAPEKICRPVDTTSECSRSCLKNAECGAAMSCTFETTYIDEIGLCCPLITGTPEEPFSCHVGSSGSDEKSRWMLAELLLACTIMGRIRTRAAGRKGSSADKQRPPRR